MNLVVLCLAWIIWCVVHSLLIHPAIIDFLVCLMPRLDRYYRLLYNGLALLTLVPLVVVTPMVEGAVVFGWQGGTIPGRILLLAIALLLFRGGAKRYDMRYFIGLKQLRTGERSQLMTDSPNFSDSGVFGMTRHPWYLGSLLFVWSALPAYPLPEFLVAIILSLYLVTGTFIEERKIIAAYGDAYRLYQQRVSMLFPWKWLKKKLL